MSPAVNPTPAPIRGFGNTELPAAAHGVHKEQPTAQQRSIRLAECAKFLAESGRAPSRSGSRPGLDAPGDSKERFQPRQQTRQTRQLGASGRAARAPTNYRRNSGSRSDRPGKAARAARSARDRPRSKDRHGARAEDAGQGCAQARTPDRNRRAPAANADPQSAEHLHEHLRDPGGHHFLDCSQHGGLEGVADGRPNRLRFGQQGIKHALSLALERVENTALLGLDDLCLADGGVFLRGDNLAAQCLFREFLDLFPLC